MKTPLWIYSTNVFSGLSVKARFSTDRAVVAFLKASPRNKTNVNVHTTGYWHSCAILDIFNYVSYVRMRVHDSHRIKLISEHFAGP